MFCVMCFQHRTVYHGFRYVIGNEFCPDLLFNILRFIGVEIAQPYGIFQFPKGRFDPPSGVVQGLDLLRLEIIPWQIRNNAFIRGPAEREPYNTERKLIGVIILDDEAGHHVIPVRVKRAEEIQEKADLIILFTKTISSRTALESEQHFMGKTPIY